MAKVKRVKKVPEAVKHLARFSYAPHDATIRQRVSKYLFLTPKVRTAVLFALLASIPTLVLNPIFNVFDFIGLIATAPGSSIQLLALVLLCLFMVVFGYFTTLLLIVLASAAHMRFDLKRGFREGPFVILMLAVGFAIVAVSKYDWSIRYAVLIKSTCHFLLIFPYKLSIGWLASKSAKRHNPQTQQARSLVSAFFWALLIIALGLGEVSGWIQLQIESIPIVQKFIPPGPDIGEFVTAVLSLAVVASIGVVEIIRLDRRYRVPSERKYKIARWFDGLMDFLFGKSDYEEDAEEEVAVEVPESSLMVTNSISEIEEETGKTPDWASFNPAAFGESSAKSFFSGSYKKYESAKNAFGQDNWSTLFGVNRPTTNQNRAIDGLFRADSSPDLQVEGDRGTGKTTVCLAAAVGSVLLRREHVAFFVHSKSEIKEVLHRLKKILHDANLDGLISAARLDGELLERLRNKKALPHIQVGTISDFQSVYFDSSIPSSIRSFGLRKFGMMILDGLAEFSPDERVEAPFVLQKVRLLQKAARSDVQFLVTTFDNKDFPALQNYIWRRLVSPVDSSARVIRLDRFSPPPESIQRVSMVDILHHRDAVVDLCRGVDSAWGQIVVVRPDLPDVEAEQEQYKREFAATGANVDIKVIKSGLPFVLGGQVQKEWMVVVDDGTLKSREIALSLNWKPFAKRMKYLTFAGKYTPANPHRHVTVVGSSASQGRWLPHLGQLCEILSPDSPIERDAWVQFGLPPVGAVSPRDEAEQVVHNTLRLRIDPPDLETKANRASSTLQGGSIFPWVSVVGDRSLGIADYSQTAGCRLVVGDDPPELVVVRGKDADPKRIAEWRVSGQGLLTKNHIDLASVSQFELRTESASYTPRSISVDSSRGANRVIIEADDMRTENGFRFPAWEWKAKFDFSKGVHFHERSTARPSTQWFEVRNDEFRSTRWMHYTNTWKLNALYRAQSREPLPVRDVEFDAECGVTFINFNLDQPYSSDEFIQAVSNWSDWSTRTSDLPFLPRTSVQKTRPMAKDSSGKLPEIEDVVQEPLEDQEELDIPDPVSPSSRLDPDAFLFLPVVTGVLSGSFFRIAQGAEDLGRILAFRNPRGGITLLVLETWSNLGSLGEVFELFLNDRPLWNAFIEKVTKYQAKDFRNKNVLEYARCLWAPSEESESGARDPRIFLPNESELLQKFIRQSK